MPLELTFSSPDFSGVGLLSGDKLVDDIILLGGAADKKQSRLTPLNLQCKHIWDIILSIQIQNVASELTWFDTEVSDRERSSSVC